MSWPTVSANATKTSSAHTKSIEYRRGLIARAKAGDSAALQEFHKINLGLTEHLIKQYSKWVSPSEVDDMRQEAFLGLSKGIRAYNLSNTAGKAPESYIFSWVRAYISNYANGHRREVSGKTVSVSPFVSDDDKPANRDEYEYHNAQSPEAPVDEQYHLHAVRQWFEKTLKTLLPKEQLIMRRRLLEEEPETLAAISVDIGLSRERVRQIELAVYAKLREKARKELRDVAANDTAFGRMRDNASLAG